MEASWIEDKPPKPGTEVWERKAAGLTWSSLLFSDRLRPCLFSRGRPSLNQERAGGGTASLWQTSLRDWPTSTETFCSSPMMLGGTKEEKVFPQGHINLCPICVCGLAVNTHTEHLSSLRRWPHLHLTACGSHIRTKHSSIPGFLLNQSLSVCSHLKKS